MICTLYVSFYYSGEMWVVTRRVGTKEQPMCLEFRKLKKPSKRHISAELR